MKFSGVCACMYGTFIIINFKRENNRLPISYARKNLFGDIVKQ